MRGVEPATREAKSESYKSEMYASVSIVSGVAVFLGRGRASAAVVYLAALLVGPPVARISHSATWSVMFILRT